METNNNNQPPENSFWAAVLRARGTDLQALCDPVCQDNLEGWLYDIVNEQRMKEARCIIISEDAQNENN